MNNLYNQRVEPPADLKIEEPDTRGTKTIREALAKHQQSQACNRCHSKIDPLGFALEYYDPVGRRREQYRHVKEIASQDEATTFTKKIKFTTAPIDAAMRLPNGRPVHDMLTLKAALMADKERILKGIIEKLISYAHGRDLTLADRAHVNTIFESIAPINSIPTMTGSNSKAIRFPWWSLVDGTRDSDTPYRNDRPVGAIH